MRKVYASKSLLYEINSNVSEPHTKTNAIDPEMVYWETKREKFSSTVWSQEDHNNNNKNNINWKLASYHREIREKNCQQASFRLKPTNSLEIGNDILSQYKHLDKIHSFNDHITEWIVMNCDFFFPPILWYFFHAITIYHTNTMDRQKIDTNVFFFLARKQNCTIRKWITRRRKSFAVALHCNVQFKMKLKFFAKFYMKKKVQWRDVLRRDWREKFPQNHNQVTFEIIFALFFFWIFFGPLKQWMNPVNDVQSCCYCCSMI